MEDVIVLVVRGVDVASETEGYQDTIKVMEFINSLGLDVDSFAEGIWHVSPLSKDD